MKELKRYLPVIVWCAVIFTFSSWKVPPSPKDTILNFLLKKTAHVIEYAVLYFLTFKARNYHKIRDYPDYLSPLAFTILYAISDEIHQSFVPGRHARLYDIGFDALGALLSISVLKKKN